MHFWLAFLLCLWLLKRSVAPLGIVARAERTRYNISVADPLLYPFMRPCAHFTSHRVTTVARQSLSCKGLRVGNYFSPNFSIFGFLLFAWRCPTPRTSRNLIFSKGDALWFLLTATPHVLLGRGSSRVPMALAFTTPDGHRQLPGRVPLQGGRCVVLLHLQVYMH